jgi:hypothetical protein
MRTLLICHDGALLDRDGLARWLASFTTLVGIVVIREDGGRMRQRVRREVRRVGPARFLDVLAFRAYYRLFVAGRDRAWEAGRLRAMHDRFAPLDASTEVLWTHSPNTPEVAAFLRRLAPDVTVARCKTLLKEEIFSVPTLGTFVMHPGICPEYRNAHGCFWARATGDRDKVGMTLLRIDKGVDTGPVYGYFYPGPDASDAESHVVLQHRVVLDNLDAIRERLEEIRAGRARPLDTSGRKSNTWGQPWLTSHLRWTLTRGRGRR